MAKHKQRITMTEEQLNRIINMVSESEGEGLESGFVIDLTVDDYKVVQATIVGSCVSEYVCNVF
jgi:hypothetical protein